MISGDEDAEDGPRATGEDVMTAVAHLVTPSPPMPLRYALGGYVHRGLRLLILVAFAFGVAAAMLPVGLVARGFQPSVVRTNSMQPVMEAGDVVVNDVVSLSAVRVGDIITYSDPQQGPATRRVIGVDQQGPSYSFTTKSADSGPQVWSPADHDKVTRVAYLLPTVDTVLDRAAAPATRSALLVAAPAIVVLAIMRRGWAARRPRPARSTG